MAALTGSNIKLQVEDSDSVPVKTVVPSTTGNRNETSPVGRLFSNATQPASEVPKAQLLTTTTKSTNMATTATTAAAAAAPATGTSTPALTTTQKLTQPPVLILAAVGGIGAGIYAWKAKHKMHHSAGIVLGGILVGAVIGYVYVSMKNAA